MYKKIIMAVILLLCVVFTASCAKTEATKNQKKQNNKRI